MTDRHVHSAEFDAKIKRGGIIQIPDNLIENLGLADGTTVSVRVTGRSAMTSLKRSGVTNDEIDRIAAMQLEPSGQVVKFLLSEGVLRKRGVGRNRRWGPGAAG